MKIRNSFLLQKEGLRKVFFLRSHLNKLFPKKSRVAQLDEVEVLSPNHTFEDLACNYSFW